MDLLYADYSCVEVSAFKARVLYLEAVAMFAISAV